MSDECKRGTHVADHRGICPWCGQPVADDRVWCFSYALRGGAGGLRFSDPYTKDTIEAAVVAFREQNRNELTHLKIELLDREYYNVVGTVKVKKGS